MKPMGEQAKRQKSATIWKIFLVIVGIVGVGWALVVLVVYQLSRIEIGSVLMNCSVQFCASKVSDLTSDQLRCIEKIMSSGRLSHLPGSASKIRFGGWSGISTGSYYLSFYVPSEESLQFVASSPGIDSMEYEEFSPAHMNLAYMENVSKGEGNGRSYSDEQRIGLTDDYIHRRYQVDSEILWYRPTVRVMGKRYKISPDNTGRNWGEVVLDLDLDRVWVNVVWD